MTNGNNPNMSQMLNPSPCIRIDGAFDPITLMVECIDSILSWNWFDEEDAHSPQFKRVLPMLLCKVYIAARHNQPCEIPSLYKQLEIEPTKTGPRYITLAQEADFVTVVANPEDKRKQVVYPTAKLEHFIWRNMKRFGKTFDLVTSLFSTNEILKEMKNCDEPIVRVFVSERLYQNALNEAVELSVASDTDTKDSCTM